MSQWPGTPKSQQSPPINPPSVRKFPSLNEHSTMGEVADAVKVAFNGLTNHEQAFANLPSQIASQAATAATAAVEKISSQITAGVLSFNSQTGAVIYFPNLGRVNNQLGIDFYSTSVSDAGQKIIAGDSTPVSIALTPVTPPWFTLIGNDSTSTVGLSSTAPIAGPLTISPGCFTFVYFDGTQFWSEGVQFATDSTCGIVKPDQVTTEVDSTSGTLYTRVSVGDGAPAGTPSTPGNPFYFDSTVSPWHGYVYALGSWNRFS